MALDRRSFLMFVAGGAVGTGLTPFPWKLTDDISIWTQNWPWIPSVPKGQVQSKPSLVKMGASPYGIRVNTVGGRPITAVGNPDHPLSLGGIDPLAACSVQMLYSPARIQSPLKKTSQGTFTAISWEEGERILQQQLAASKGRSQALACISGDETGSTNDVLADFLGQMGSDAFFHLPSEATAYSRTWNDIMAGEGNVGFDLEGSDLVFCLGADALESWGTAVRNQAAFGRNGFRLFFAGPVQNNTAAMAERWIPVQEDGLGHLALGLAYHIFLSGRPERLKVRGLSRFKRFVLDHAKPEKTAKQTGLSESEIRTLARELLQADRPVVLPGSLAGQGASAFTIFAGLCLNVLLDRINAKGGMQCIPNPPKVLENTPNRPELLSRDLLGYLQDLQQEPDRLPDLLLLSEANPFYELPHKELLEGTLGKIPFKVSFSQYMDESAARCDLILPAPTFLERLDDAFTPFGSPKANYSLAQPVTRPVADSKPTADILLGVARKLGLTPGVASYKALLQTKAELLGADWQQLIAGKAWTDATTTYPFSLRLWNGAIEKMCSREPRSSSEYPIQLAPQNDLKNGTPRTGIPPFGLNTITEQELQDGRLSVRLNPKTAKKQGLREGTRVKLLSKDGECQARIRLDESVMPGAVAAPLGFGHTHWDEFSRTKGDNVTRLFTVYTEPGSALRAWSGSRLQIQKI